MSPRSRFEIAIRMAAGVATAVALALLTSCASSRTGIHAKEYYESGALKRETHRNAFEYEIWDYFDTGMRKKITYGTKENRHVKEYFENGTLKREEHTTPNDEEFEEMRWP